MGRKIREIDWNQYNQMFPDRYLNPSDFDEQVRQIVEGLPYHCHTCLDIGGGVDGTQALKNASLCYFLDPSIKVMPDWMSGRVTWKTKLKLDLIVARGVFNYLTPWQIRKIPTMLKPDGMFMANSFTEPKEIKRKYKNSKSGCKGEEVSRYDPEKRMIVHDLMPHGVDFIVRHEFWFYTVDEMLAMLSGFKTEIQSNGKNSLIIRVYGGVIEQDGFKEHLKPQGILKDGAKTANTRRLLSDLKNKSPGIIEPWGPDGGIVPDEIRHDD